MKGVLMMKECEWCAKQFQPKRKDSKFCQEDHYTKCKKCSTEILIKQMKRIPTYCSLSCGSRDRSYEKTCEVCNEVFIAGKNDAKFCTKTHYKPCEVCSNDFVFDPYQPTRTCSRKCGAGITDFKARNDKTAQTLSKKYGEEVTNPSQLTFVKEKKKRFYQEKFGVDNPSQVPELQEKRKNTNLNRYGVENGGGAPEVQDRIRKTNLEKYGVENVFQAKEIKEKIQKTLKSRYGEGITNPMQIQEVKEKARQATLEKFGVHSVLSLKEIQESAIKNTRRVSRVNRLWQKRLEENLGVTWDLERNISQGMYVDLKCRTICIDVNPAVTHNNSVSFIHKTKRCKEGEVCKNPKHAAIHPMTHQLRFLAAEEEGVTLLQYFDWMDEEIFISVVRSKLHLDENKAPARKCEVKKISQKVANEFLRDNHLLGATKNQTFCVGLYYGDDLVHVQTYGKARMNKNYEWEAIRSCSKMNWHVQGGVRKCDSYFIKTVSPNSIISYVDLALGGGVTEANNPGWKLLSTNKPSATWCYVGSSADLAGKPLFVRDSSARKLSADRLLGFEVGSKYPELHPDGSPFTNSDVLLREGYVKVFDAGTRTFGWRV